MIKTQIFAVILVWLCCGTVSYGLLAGQPLESNFKETAVALGIFLTGITISIKMLWWLANFKWEIEVKIDHLREDIKKIKTNCPLFEEEKGSEQKNCVNRDDPGDSGCDLKI